MQKVSLYFQVIWVYFCFLFSSFQKKQIETEFYNFYSFLQISWPTFSSVVLKFKIQFSHLKKDTAAIV